MIPALLASLMIGQSPPTPAASMEACFRILADAEGEMTLADDPAWRRGAARELDRMRADNRRRLAEIGRALAKNRRARDGLQRDHDRGRIDPEDFSAARSELETEARRLTAERDTPQFPACGF